MIISIAIIVMITAVSITLVKAKDLQKIHIQKVVLIKGSLHEVFNQVVFLNNFPNWSPFLEADPSQEVKVVGEDGQMGAQYHWEGNNGKDIGYQEIKEIVPLKYVKMGCDIQKPFEAKPIFEYSLEVKGDEVKVTQDFYLESKTGDAVFMWIFGTKKNMAKMNERGLALLKEFVEKN